MGLLLLALALTFLIFAGAGVALILYPRASLIELVALSFLFGTAFVSMASFALGFLFSGGSLKWSVAGLCFLAGLWGLGRSQTILDRHGIDWRWVMLGAIQTGFISWLAYRRDLGWDGLLVFEIKARLAFLSGGVIPAEYFTDPSRQWSHPSYPLLLPLTESWIYLWIGHPDQRLVKLLFPLFFVSALTIFYSVNRRKGCSSVCSLMLLMTMPLLWLSDGSATSGYADFPLAVFYLAAVAYLLEYRRTGDWVKLRLAGFLLAAGCWIKREGAILWLCVLVIAAISAMKNPEGPNRTERGKWTINWHEWRRLFYVALPGLAVIAIWQAFLAVRNIGGDHDFLPLGYELLQRNISRIPTIAHLTATELLNWRNWGVLWPISVAAAIWMVTRQRQFLLPLTVFLPLLIYCGIYLFSAWPDYVMHIGNSFSRLLIQISLTALMMVTSLDYGQSTQQDSTPWTGSQTFTVPSKKMDDLT